MGTARGRQVDEVWRALELVGLRRRVEGLPRKLDTPVSVADLSEGERQLVSVARALVAGRGTKGLRALLCDEPTSALDVESDQKVHRALLGLKCTVVEVAHRLHEIDRFDKAVVMDGGRVVEMGSPLELLHDEGSRLAAMAKAAERLE